jgi:alpha-L-arabinofuranosidase
MQEKTRHGTSPSVLGLIVVVSALVWVGTAGMALSSGTGGNKQIRITVDAQKPGHTISPLLYGTNIFWVGSMNGVRQNASSEAQYRQAIEKWYGYLPMVSELGPTILRFPGGLSSNFYLWNRGIGPYSKRKPMNSKPGASDPIIGTDEFLLFCEELGAQSMITVNLNRASGENPIKMLLSPESVYRENAAVAADWVEYCNAPNDGSNPRGGVDWAAERARNGHTAPYGVKYWELGNELQDLPVGWYQKAVRLFSQAMKSVDPSIRIGALTPLKGWEAKKRNEWFRQIGETEGKLFDFWIRHSYIPGTSGTIKGFELTGKGAAISAPLNLPGPDEYEFQVRAVTRKGNADLEMSIPGTGAKQVFNVGSQIKDCSLKAKLEGKAHTLRLELTQGDDVLVYHVAKRKGSKTGEANVDLKNSPELYSLIVSGPLVAEDLWFSREEMRGKPVCVTEYNPIYETYGNRGQTPFVAQITALRDALNLGMYLQTFIRYGVEAATQWLLFGDQECFGLIEGVGFDGVHGGERGRADPHPRPSYYMLKLYRDHLTGQSLPVEVRSPSFHIGPPPPYESMGFVGHKSLETTFLQAVAATDEEGRRLCLVVQNLSEKDSLTAAIDMRGFVPGTQAETYTLLGESPWSTNEPETCPKGDCVRDVKKGLTVSGDPFTYTFPPHSATALVFYKKGVQREEVGPPQTLRGQISGSRATLTWEPPGGSPPGGYHLYRSRLSSGPFRHLIETLPATKNAASDTLQDSGDYTYAVRALNALGEEGPFSNIVKLKYAKKK